MAGTGPPSRMATMINPASPGASLGRRLALMRERVLPPGAIPRTKLVWVRCKTDHRDCPARGNVLVCGRCWDERKEWGEVVIHGPLEHPLAVVCETCGGRDSEVTGYGEASGTEFSKRRSGSLYYSPETKSLEEEP